jgi:hypothetical protein
MRASFLISKEARPISRRKVAGSLQEKTNSGPQLSQEFKKRIGGFFGALLQHPMMSGISQDNFVCIGDYNFHFAGRVRRRWPFSPPMVRTGMVSLALESSAKSLAACWKETK